MKNLKKVTRGQMRNIQGGIARGMVRCKNPETCVVQWGWATGSSSNCGQFDFICGEPPVEDPCLYNACV